MLRWLFCIALALAAIALAQVWPANSADPSFDFSDRKPIKRPNEIQGWALMRVCSVTGSLDHRFTEYFYIRPNFIIAVGNPPTSPDPCVALHGQSGRRIFVEGSLEGIARYVMEVSD